jgi:PPOX class probable F420-dependent enzyme
MDFTLPMAAQVGEAQNAYMWEPWQRQLLDECRVARLATIMPDGRPRLVAACYAVVRDLLYIPVDEKPKRSIELARLRDIRRDPRVTFLVDRYDDDWSRLAWVRVDADARVLLEGAAAPDAIDALRSRYPQYATMAIEALPLIEVAPARVTSWRWPEDEH